MSTLSNSTEQKLSLRLSYAEDDRESRLELRLENGLDRELRQWCLHLDLQRDLRGGSGTRMSRIGSHLRLRPADEAVLPRGGEHVLLLVGAPGLLQRLSDLPTGFFLSTGAETHPVQLLEHNLPSKIGAPCAHAVPSSHPETTTTRLLPAASSQSSSTGLRSWPAQIGFHAASQAIPAVNWLQSMLGETWHTSDSAETAELRCVADTTMAEEAYRLDISPKQITLEAATVAGFSRGAASLLQLREYRDGQHHMPCLQLEDQPHYHYRALMVDCARHFHDLETLFDLLDWMALYKLNHFHWHLTDDEAWRLEIAAYPQLTDIGAWRGHREVLPPQLGSGPERYGGYYSKSDVTKLVNYAADRGITVVPEIDIPGHCRACIESLPELLRDCSDTSQFQSVQFFNDNVLNPGLPGTYDFLDVVLEEVCEMFPGPYVHIGADEVPEGVWEGSRPCRELMQRHGYQDPRELQGHLLKHAQEFLATRGRTLVGWEEAAQGGKLARNTPVCAWTGDNAVQQLADEGYPVISCPAPRAYLDLAWSNDPTEPGLHWAGTADLRTCYEQPPFPPGVDKALGVQANLWSELLRSREILEYMMFPRVLATAEWGWNGDAGKNWPDFRARAELALDYLRSRGVKPHALDS